MKAMVIYTGAKENPVAVCINNDKKSKELRRFISKVKEIIQMGQDLEIKHEELTTKGEQDASTNS